MNKLAKCLLTITCNCVIFRRMNDVVTDHRGWPCPVSLQLPAEVPGLPVSPHVMPCFWTSQMNANTLSHTRRQRTGLHAPMCRHKEHAEDKHHISTEVVNRPSEAFLKGLGSSAFIEPLSDY